MKINVGSGVIIASKISPENKARGWTGTAIVHYLPQWPPNGSQEWEDNLVSMSYIQIYEPEDFK